ncbi:MAG: hypothetical protein ACD_41C00387G0005, partial [uncultured bacterium]
MQISKYTTQSSAATLAELHVTATTGLTASQATQLRQEHGRNAMTEHHVTGWSILLRQFKSSFVYLLIGAAILAIVLGEMIDGIMIIIFVGVNALLGFFQEYRSEKTSQLLKQYTVPHTKVRRDSTEQDIPSIDIVPGDIILLEAGDIIPADCRIISETDCMVNETVLTGESIPIKKIAEPLTEATDEIYEATNILFAGTSLVSGEATSVVIATGSTTAMGEVAKLTTETKRVSSFEVEINHFSRFILRLVVITLICVFIVNLLLKGTTDWVDLVIFAIALAVGVIPEGLPVVTTFSLSRGARRLAKQQVVVKRLTAIEDLGGIEVLCTDKTGTITENKLTVAEVTGAAPDTTVRYAALAADEDVHDPFDIALCQAANIKPGARTEEIPFDPDRRRNSVLVNHELIVRGASEVICGFCPDMTKAQCQQLADWVAEQGQRGRRVIAVAKKAWRKDTYEVSDEQTKLTYIGAVS